MARASPVMEPQAAMLGRRLHLQHGPIDLIIEAWGDENEIRAAYSQARDAFTPVLQTLVDELPTLRRDIRTLNESPPLVRSSPRKPRLELSSPRKRGSPNPAARISGPVAQRMISAVTPHTDFITPMAAVAGSVADHILGAMRKGRRLRKAMVNNGGDIALWLGPTETATIGIGNLQDSGATLRPMTLSASSGIGGIATSGWHGRSDSLGIADFVTVFAPNDATADAAATLIANAVDLPDSVYITRERADILSPDSDLGARAVTVAVAPLPASDVRAALSRGLAKADALRKRGVIIGAVLGLQDQILTSTATAAKNPPELENAQ